MLSCYLKHLYLNQYQQTNGYNKETLYFFDYQPLKWKIVEESEKIKVTAKFTETNEVNKFEYNKEKSYRRNNKWKRIKYNEVKNEN